MEIEEGIRRRQRAIHRDRRVDDLQPRHGHRLVIPARGFVRDLVGGVVGPDAVAQLVGGRGVAQARHIQIGQLDMRAVMPLVEGKRARLELPDKLVVIHGSPNDLAARLRAGAAGRAQPLAIPRLRRKQAQHQDHMKHS